MPLPICFECGLSMRCHRNGQPVIVTFDREKEQPYKLFYTDVYKCPGCDVRVVTGFSEPIEHHEAGFDSEVERVTMRGDFLRAF